MSWLEKMLTDKAVSRTTQDTGESKAKTLRGTMELDQSQIILPP